MLAVYILEAFNKHDQMKPVRYLYIGQSGFSGLNEINDVMQISPTSSRLKMAYWRLGRVGEEQKTQQPFSSHFFMWFRTMNNIKLYEVHIYLHLYLWTCSLLKERRAQMLTPNPLSSKRQTPCTLQNIMRTNGEEYNDDSEIPNQRARKHHYKRQIYI